MIVPEKNNGHIRSLVILVPKKSSHLSVCNHSYYEKKQILMCLDNVDTIRSTHQSHYFREANLLLTIDNNSNSNKE